MTEKQKEKRLRSAKSVLRRDLKNSFGKGRYYKGKLYSDDGKQVLYFERKGVSHAFVETIKQVGYKR